MFTTKGADRNVMSRTKQPQGCCWGSTYCCQGQTVSCQVHMFELNEQICCHCHTIAINLTFKCQGQALIENVTHQGSMALLFLR